MNRRHVLAGLAVVAGAALAGCGGERAKPFDAYSDEALLAAKPPGTNAVIVRVSGFGTGTIVISDPSQNCVTPGEYVTHNASVCWAYVPVATTSVTVDAAPGAGSRFTGWASGPCAGSSDPSCVVPMDRDRIMSSGFIPEATPGTTRTEYTVSVQVIGFVDGEITGTASPAAAGGLGLTCRVVDYEDRVNVRRTCSAVVPAGTQVTLTATPSSAGTQFGGWGGGCTGTGPCTLTMDQDRGATALFVRSGSAPGPSVESFVAAPGTITAGESATLSWAVLNATSLSIDHGVGTVTGSSVSVSPAVTTTYTLLATNASGTTARSVTVTVASAPVSRYTVGGTVTGLLGTGLVLRNAGGDDLPVLGSGTFAFATTLASGAAYAVTVARQPTAPAQTCVVADGTGVVGTADVAVSVTCTTDTYALRGTASGLSGSGLVVSGAFDGGTGEDLPISSDGAFTFATRGPAGSVYSVAVRTQPTSPAQTCTVTGATGILDAGTSVSVSCTTNTYQVGGTISGLAGTGLVLATAGEPDRAVAAGATSFTFASPLPSGTPYAVTVVQQPSSPSQTCTITNGAGTIGSSDVSAAVTCTTSVYGVGGTISGLAGSGLVLATAGEANLAIPAGATSFTFAGPLPSGAAYGVTVVQQPTSPSQTCTVANGSGTIAAGDVSVAVACTTNVHQVGGTISGLAGSGLVLATAGEPDLAVVAGTTSFSFAGPLRSGTSYAVVVVQQPSDPVQTCTVANGSGTIVDADVIAAVTCTTNVYGLGGTISGLAGTGLVLATTGQPNLALAAGATSFAFANPFPSGTTYEVTVLQQPVNPAQFCEVLNGTGTMVAGDVTNVAVGCRAASATLAAGSSFTLRIRPDGTLWVLGNNDHGQLGDGTTTARSSPIQIGTGYAAVAAGYAHAVAVKADGTLWAWGLNGNGQLGDGTTSPQPSPVQIGTGFVSVAAGDYHTLAVGTDGTLWAWGSNAYAQLGDGTTDQQTWPVQIGTGFASVAGGAVHSAAVKTDGTLWAWGYNAEGEVGNGTRAQQNTPVQVGSGFASVAAGGAHTVAVKLDGTLWAWGFNGYGALGDGTTTQQETPVQVGTGFASVAAGRHHTAAVKTDGTLWAWGRNAFGQVGDGSTLQRTLPVQIGVDFASVAAGDDHTVAVKRDGTLWGWGSNDSGQVGSGPTTEQTSPAQIGTAYASVAAGYGHTVAVKTDGTLWAWGSNDWGQLGDGTATMRTAPVQIGTGFASVTAGSGHTVAVKTNRTVWAWGRNDLGQLGDGTTIQRTLPVQVGTATTWVRVAAGSHHTAGVRTNGQLWAWGYNANGQLGDGTTIQRTAPVQIGTAYAAVAAGVSHTVALKNSGALWAWGDNASGQLGDGTTTRRTSPVQIAAGVVHTAIAAGALHTVAVRTGGTLWAWGYNANGQLGDGTVLQRSAPVQIGTAAIWAKVAGGGAHTAAVRTDGTLWAWGSNDYGQVGDGTTTQQLAPVQIGTGYSAVAAGSSHCVAVKTDQTLWAWGSNGTGQLGMGDWWKVVPTILP